MTPGTLLLVAGASAIGGALRLVAGSLAAPASPAAFPAVTLLVNVAGSLLLGVVLRPVVSGEAELTSLRIAATVGLCGGFTTFSAFSYDAVRLLQLGHPGRAAAYVAGSVVLSLGAVALGLWGWRGT
jgi:fluoride exporter